MPTRHLLAVWNPSYARNAMEEHLAVLLGHAERLRAKPDADDQAYVWWGRVHSLNRKNVPENLTDVRAIETVLGTDEPPETHVYLTDYQSLYVADLGEIHFGPLPEREREFVPRYYEADHLICDFWLKLWDIRRLVSNDLPAVIEELKRLNNVHYHDRPVSLYGGMVNLPLVVTRPDDTSFFDPDERDVATSSALWAQFDAEMGAGVAAVERSIRDDMIGERAWSAYAPTVRNFIATGEKIFREHRGDPAFDFAPVLGSFAKALEVHLGQLLRQTLATFPVAERMMNVEGRSEDLSQRRGRMMAQLVDVLTGDERRARMLGDSLVNGRWLVEQFSAVLDEFRQVRNDGMHELRIDRRTAMHWRNQLLGVGCTGHFVELARTVQR